MKNRAELLCLFFGAILFLLLSPSELTKGPSDMKLTTLSLISLCLVGCGGSSVPQRTYSLGQQVSTGTPVPVTQIVSGSNPDTSENDSADEAKEDDAGSVITSPSADLSGGLSVDLDNSDESLDESSEKEEETLTPEQEAAAELASTHLLNAYHYELFEIFSQNFAVALTELSANMNEVSYDDARTRVQAFQAAYEDYLDFYAAEFVMYLRSITSGYLLDEAQIQHLFNQITTDFDQAWMNAMASIDEAELAEYIALSTDSIEMRITDLYTTMVQIVNAYGQSKDQSSTE